MNEIQCYDGDGIRPIATVIEFTARTVTKGHQKKSVEELSLKELLTIESGSYLVFFGKDTTPDVAKMISRKIEKWIGQVVDIAITTTRDGDVFRGSHVIINKVAVYENGRLHFFCEPAPY